MEILWKYGLGLNFACSMLLNTFFDMLQNFQLTISDSLSSCFNLPQNPCSPFYSTEGNLGIPLQTLAIQSSACYHR